MVEKEVDDEAPIGNTRLCLSTLAKPGIFFGCYIFGVFRKKQFLRNFAEDYRKFSKGFSGKLRHCDILAYFQ